MGDDLARKLMEQQVATTQLAEALRRLSQVHRATADEIDALLNKVFGDAPVMKPPSIEPIAPDKVH